ncbi:MAG: hypothetical protein ACRCTZ_04625 [Sarcina sp.]
MEKVKYSNRVIIAGEIASIYDEKTTGAGETWEKFGFKMKIKVSEEESFDVKFESNVFKFGSTEENPKFKGFETIFNEVKTIEDNEVGDKIICYCKVIDNSFYQKGELIENVEYMVDVASRDKGKGKFNPSALYEIYGRIEDITENEDSTLDVKLLVNNYASANSIKGHVITMKVLEKDIVDGFKETFKVGDISLFEGYVKSLKTKVEIPEEDLKELEVRGLGRRRTEIEEENARRKELRENGKFTYKVVLCVDGSDLPLTEDEIKQAELPFTQPDCEDMILGIKDTMEKSKERDMKNNPNSYDNVESDDVPF